MKKRFALAMLIGMISYNGFSQVSTACISIQIETSEEAKEAEACVLEIANFILTQNLFFTSEDFPKMKRDVLRWINRTMSYTIDINPNIVAFCTKKNENLLPVFHAALAKAALSGSTNFHRQAAVILAEYIKDEKNNVRHTGPVKRFLTAVESGKFAQYYN